MRQFTNNRTNEVVQTLLSNTELAAKFVETANDQHWVWFWITKHVNEQQPVNPQTREMIDFLADSFLLAVGMGLKRPMIRLHHKGMRFKIYLSARGTLCLKSGRLSPGTNNPVGDEQYVGCISRGKFLFNDRKQILDEELEFLAELTVDPTGFMAKCSKDMDRCCYCNQPLEDKRSKDVGYGATCAERWGLPWGKTYDEKVPSFAQLWSGMWAQSKRDIRALCQAIRQSPYDSLSWMALGDALEEAGYQKRPSVPEKRVIIPNV